MTWNRIKTEGIRNLQPLAFTPGKKTSFFTGENGAGKTSILEAICLLSTGKSFRSLQTGNFINKEVSNGYAYGEWQDESNNTQKFGVRRTRNKTLEIHKNGEKQTTLEQINRCFALKVLTPDVFSSLSGTSEQRRNLIDWTLFHVEHTFRLNRKKYNHLLKQRNAILKQHKNKHKKQEKIPRQLLQELTYWDQQLSQVGESLEQQRRENIQQLQQQLHQRLSWPGNWPHNQEITIKYYKGWPTDKTLAEQLHLNQAKDLLKGYTQNGPHRFDINVYLGKDKAVEICSRGELKTLAVACQLLQIHNLVYQDLNAVVLIDDLFAELDYEHANWCLQQIHKLINTQSFITGVSIPEQIKTQYSMKGMRWFHVEHGKIQPIETLE